MKNIINIGIKNSFVKEKINFNPVGIHKIIINNDLSNYYYNVCKYEFDKDKDIKRIGTVGTKPDTGLGCWCTYMIHAGTNTILEGFCEEEIFENENKIINFFNTEVKDLSRSLILKGDHSLSEFSYRYSYPKLDSTDNVIQILFEKF